MDDDMAKTAKKTIIIGEKLIETEDIRYLLGKVQLPIQTTNAIVKMPFEANPTSCYPLYIFDPLYIQEYLNMNFEEFKNKYIINKTPAQYLEKAGGIQTILNILL